MPGRRQAQEIPKVIRLTNISVFESVSLLLLTEVDRSYHEKRRKKATHLLNVFVSKRNQLFEFLKKNVHSVHDFGWKSTFQVPWGLID